MKTIIHQSNSEDHIASILKNIVLQLGVSVTFSTIDNAVNKHPLSSNISNLNDILNEWGISTKPRKATFQELMRLKCPNLARVGTYRERFILITQVNPQTVTYIDTKEGLVTCNHYLFEQNWDGVVEILELKSDCGEKHYQEKRFAEKKEQRNRLYLKILKPILRKQSDLSHQLLEIRKYKNPQISRQLLLYAPSIHIPRTKFNIDCGPENANIQLTLFISPTEVKSGNMFLALKKLVTEVENTRLNVKLIPDNTLADRVIGVMMAYLSSHTSNETVDLLEKWFIDRTKNLNDFTLKNQIQSHPSTMEQILMEYRTFLMDMKGITPDTLLINGKKVPELFDLEDIRFQIVYDPVRLYPAVVTEKEKFWKGKKPVHA